MDEGGGRVAEYPVRCVVTDGSPHEHVVAVDADAPGGSVWRWTIVGVIGAIRNGATFRIGDAPPASGTLEPAVCQHCARVTLVASAGASLPPHCG